MSAVGRLLALSYLRNLTKSRATRRFQLSLSRSQSNGSSVDLFDKILVANRGEIACRVMGTARELGIRTVAVYSEADKHAMHVAMADEAYCIGPAPSSESYLRMDKIINVAKRTGAQAIHPGYGFLSENKKFAELCQKEGVEFIGPPPSAIEKMGIKRVSKEIMSASGVPVVPGYFGKDQSDSLLKKEADKIGYPILIKADLGGGGKGMRIVQGSEDFQSALDACRSEAMKSFSDDKVLLEKFVDTPRHVEVQVFADKHGNTVHLFERDCSVQRRHQKIIEEAPAPDLSQTTREEMWTAAVRAAKAVGYVGAGTVEFILDSNHQFYFMEMNTRLQVEHPVTEMVTGKDLVEWQIRVAAGEQLPVTQDQIVCGGHAFEARVYAENPDESFMPSPGVLHHLQTPPTSELVRVDTGVQQGDEVTSFYDPMIAKLVVFGENRRTALKRLKNSLAHYEVAGVTTNIPFLMRLAGHSKFQDGDVHTGFIEQHYSDLFPAPEPLTSAQKKTAALALLALEQLQNEQSLSYEFDPNSVFAGLDGSRVNINHRRNVTFQHNDQDFTVEVTYTGNGQYLMKADNEDSSEPANLGLTEEEEEEDDERLQLYGFVGDQRVSASVAIIDHTLHIFSTDGKRFSVDIPQPSFYSRNSQENMGGARSPAYSTRVNKVLVSSGDSVKRGQTLMTVEGMKMETNVLAPRDGVVKEVLFSVGDVIPGNSKLIELEDQPTD